MTDPLLTMLASFNYTDADLLLVPLIPLILAGPFILLFLEYRSFARPEPLSKLGLFILVGLALFLVYALKPRKMPTIQSWGAFWRDTNGFFLVWILTALVSMTATLPVIWWEGRKNQWWRRPNKRRRKKKSRD